MSSTVSTGSPHNTSIFAITRTKVLLGVLLIVAWTVASITPHYSETIKTRVKQQYDNAIERLPRIKIDWYPDADPRDQFNSSKVALLIEPRPLPQIVPQMLHMMAVVPPDWRFVFVGTRKSVISVSRSYSAQYHAANGKLDLIVIPEPWSLDNGHEDRHRLLTDIRFYDELLPGAEWVLNFEVDSILCANSHDSLDNWLGYSWAGAARFQGDKFAGNGGLTLRRVSKVREVLKFQSRYNDSNAEDEWFGKRLLLLPGAKVANGRESKQFAVEDAYAERPMGYHLRNGANGMNLADEVWKDPERRRSNFDWCPELAIVMPMKLERERCDGDNYVGDIVDPNSPPEEEHKEEEHKQEEHKQEEHKQEEHKQEEHKQEEHKQEEHKQEEQQKEDKQEDNKEANPEENHVEVPPKNEEDNKQEIKEDDKEDNPEENHVETPVENEGEKQEENKPAEADGSVKS